MKRKEARYERAVERIIANINTNSGMKQGQQFTTTNAAKVAAGIRQTDKRFDTTINFFLVVTKSINHA